MLITGMLLGTIMTSADRAAAVEVAEIRIQSPQSHQVVQRDWFVPQRDRSEAQDDGNRGFATVVIRAEKPRDIDGRFEFRVVPLVGASGRGTDWIEFNSIPLSPNLEAHPKITSGGWYRLEVRCRASDRTIALGSVEPFGVGEVFVVAGQSYATNCNDEQFKVGESQQRVVAFDSTKGSWGVAHDPQPTPDGSTGGSIWPPLGDALVNDLQIPIGFANVGVGATSSGQWLPGQSLHDRLVATGKALGRFRAVLWQQGESDVIAKTPTETYIRNLKAIREAASEQWEIAPTWYLAKSTFHPTVYNDPFNEGRIRSALEELSKQPGFRAGPDTDALKGKNRGGPQSRRHFSPLGQRNAAAMWLAVLQQDFSLPSLDAIVQQLPDLHLLQPAWSSPIVYRESSILLRTSIDGAAKARLAYPAGEVLEVATADRRHQFVVGEDVILEDDKQSIRFLRPGPIQPLTTDDLYPPIDAPNSYRHRSSNPQQNLLYRPGKWFHEHNVEITYRRRDVPQKPPLGINNLPQTTARLKSGKTLTIAISGDSISTGLDASGLFQTAPFQPGYPDLVAAQLQASFGSSVKLQNRAVSGWSIANGISDLEKLHTGKPDLIIVAYGMNDVGRRDPKWFLTQAKSFIERVRAADAAAHTTTELILVSPMLGNSEWVHTPRDMFTKYRDELRSLEGPGVAFADVTYVWEQMLQHKHDLDLTGNGLNHPNDFGHRLYAQTILSLLVTPPRE